MKLWLDTETYSEIPISHGTHRYAEGAEVIMVQVAIDDGPVDVWDVQDIPDWVVRLQKLIDDADEIIIQNSAFDRTVLRIAHGVHIPVEKITDSMVVALMHSLPAALGQLCEALGVPADKAKDKDGKRLIHLFCKPQPANRKVRRATRETHPEDWAKFLSYGGSDITAMRECLKRMPRWNDTPAERELWRIDQIVNDRGICADLELAEKAQNAFRRASKEMAARISELTDGAVPSATQRAKLLDYLVLDRACYVEDMTKGTLAAALKDADLPPGTRELLEIRQQAAATSPAKYRVLGNATSSDGRMRGLIQFCGAARTGRDCLAEGAPVLVRDARGRVYERPVQHVQGTEQVWDGDEWVSHEGVVFSGYKNVVEHDGVVATTEHIVYISATESMTLGEAKQKGAALWAGNNTPSTN